MLGFLVIIFALYAIATGNMPITRTYGLKGNGGKLAGLLFLLIVMGSFPVDLMLSDTMKMPVGIVSSLLLIVFLPVCLIAMVKTFGNGYAKKIEEKKPERERPSVFPGTGEVKPFRDPFSHK